MLFACIFYFVPKGTLEIFGWVHVCAAGILEPLAYTRAEFKCIFSTLHKAKFTCIPIFQNTAVVHKYHQCHKMICTCTINHQCYQCHLKSVLIRFLQWEFFLGGFNRRCSHDHAAFSNFMPHIFSCAGCPAAWLLKKIGKQETQD